MGSGISIPRKRGGALSLDKRIKYLKQTPFIQYLTPETIDEFAQCFPQTIRTSPGKGITLDSRKVYIVCEGEVDLSTSYPQEGVKVETKGYLCRKRVGDIVNVVQTERDVARRMTVKSHKMKDLVEDIMTVGSGNSAILLLCGDTDALNKFSKTHPELSKPIVEIITSQIEDRLLTVPFLEEIPKSKISVLAAMCRYEAFDSGQTVFEEGSDANKLFLVLSGVAQVVAKSEPTLASRESFRERSVTMKRSLECSQSQIGLVLGSPDGTSQSHVTIAELKSGDYFGETALVFNIDRTCGVRTSDKCLFLTVHRTDFENYLKICPIEDSLKSVIKQRMVSKLSSLGIPFLNGIPHDMLQSLATSVEIEEVPANGVVFRQGDVGDRFYIIVHGGVKVDTAATSSSSTAETSDACDVAADGADNDGEDEGHCSQVASADESKSPDNDENVLGSLGPGQYFGEMSLVNSDATSGGNLRSATVTSTQKSILLSIDKDSFQRLFGQNNNILAEFEIRLLKDMTRMKHILAHSLGIVSFREFLEAEHAGENIDFWVMVTEFQESDEDNMDKRKEQAKHIFVTFCAEYADRQVNLPHAMLGVLQQKLKAINNSDEGIATDLFDAAKQEIFRLLERDKYNRYRKSHHFSSFMERLGIL